MRTIRCLVLSLACACAAFLFSLAPAAAQTLTWSGTSNAWDTTSLNWNGNAVRYADNDAVVFNDGASYPNIVVQSAGVQPASVSFASLHGGSYAYTFSGGPIDGSAAVTLSGTGSVTFSATNGYTGGTIIGPNSSLVASLAGALGTGPVTLSGGSLSVVGITPGLAVTAYVGAPAYNGNANPISVFNTLSTLNTFLGSLPVEFTGTTGLAGGVNFPDVNNPNCGFSNIGFTGVPQAGTPAYAQNSGANQPGGQAQNYTVILSGYINLPVGTTTFSTASDDGSMLFINGTAVVNNNAYQGITTRTGTYTAATAGLYPIEIAYYQGGGGNGLFASADANASGSDYLVNGAGVDQILSGGNWNYGNALNVTGASTLSASGTGTFGNFSLSGTLHVSGNVGGLSFSGNTLLSGSPALNIDAGSSVTLASPVSDGGKALTLMQMGGGSLVLTGTNSFTSGTKFQVNGGSLVAVGQNYASPGPATGPLGAAPITLDNGGLVLASNVAGVTTFDLSAGNVLSLAPSSSDWIVAGSSLAGVSGGTVMLAGATGLTVSGGQTLNLGAVNGCTLAVISALNVTAGTSTLNVIGPVSFTNFSLAGGLHVSGNNGNLPFSGSTLLSGSPVLNIDAGESMMLSSPVSDGGKALTLTQLGAGSLVLTGTNSFTSGTRFQVNGGSLVAVGQNYAAPGPATGPLGAAPITLDNGGLVLASSVAGTTTFDLSAGNVLSLAPSSSDWIVAGSSLAGVSGGTVMLAGATGLTVSGGQTLNLGAVNGCTLAISPALVFSNSGTISVGVGDVSLQPGNLSLVGTLSAAGGGTLNIGGAVTSGVYEPASGGTVVLSGSVSGGSFVPASGGTVVLSGSVSGGSFAPASGGTLFLSGTYSGTLASLAPASGGTLVISDNITRGALSIVNGGYFATGATSFGLASLSVDGGTLGSTTALTGSNAVANTISFSTNRLLNFGGTSKLQLSAAIALSSGDNYTINDPGGVGILSGVLSGAGSLTLTGNPTLTNFNTYTGGTKLGSATQTGVACPTIVTPQGLGPGTITFANGGFQASSGLVGNNAVANAWTISAGSAAYFGGANPLQLSGSASLAAGIESIHITNPGLTVTLSGLISGSGALVRASDTANQGNGTLVINNAGNTFSGGFTLQSLGGTVDVQGASTVLSGTSIVSGPLGTGTITIGSANAGWITLANSSPVPVTLANAMSLYDGCGYTSVSGLTFTGPVSLTGPGDGNGNIEFWLGTNSNVAFTGAISGGKGVNLRQGTGSSGMTLSNANNSYTGATSITMGTLIAGGNVLITGGSSSGVFGTSAGAITIGDANSGGNPAGLVTNGAYEIDREITVNGGTFSPGPVTLGTIGTGTSTYTGVIVLNSGNSVTLSAAAGGSALFSGSLSGSDGITVAATGNGNVSLASTNSYTGGTTVSSGQLTLDYSYFQSSNQIDGLSVGGIVPPASPVTLSGGTLNFKRGPNFPVNETFVSTTVAGFGSLVTVNSGQGVTVNLNQITRTGGVLDLPINTAQFTTSNPSVPTGNILGGYLSVNGYRDWAAVNVSGQVVSLGSLGLYGTDNYTSAINDVDVIAGGATGLSGPTTIDSMRFNAAARAVDLNGQTLMLASGGILVTPNAGPNQGIVNGSLTVLGTTIFNTLADVVVLQGSSGTFTVGANIVDNSSDYYPALSVGLSKGGPGTLLLSGSNTYSGPTTVSGGTLQGSVGAGNFPATTSIAVNAGAAVDFVENGASAVTSSIAVGGQGLVAKDGANSLTVTGAVSAANVQVLDGVLTLAGASVAVSGSVSVAGNATLGIDSSDAGIGPLSGSGGLSLSGTLSENATSNSEFDGLISGTGLFLKSGSGALTLTNSASSFAGTVRAAGGTLQLNNAAVLGNATLDMNAADGGTVSMPNLTSLTLGGLMGARNLAVPAGPLTIGGNNTSTTYAGSLSGATSLAKTGSGSLYLSGTNTCGPTTIGQGMLDAATAASLSGTVSVAGGAGLTIQVGDGVDGWTPSQVTSLMSSSNSSWGTNSSLGIDTTNGSLTYAGVLSQPLALSKLGANALTLSGSNSYPYGTSVSGGTLTAGNNSALGTGPLNVATGATMNFNSSASAPSLSGLSGGGNVVLSGTLTVNNAANCSFAGVISQSATTANLIKTGSGTLTLVGASTYTNGTAINQGMVIAPVGGLGSGPLTLAGGTFQPALPLTSGLSAQYYGPNFPNFNYITTTSLSAFNSSFAQSTVALTDNVANDVLNGVKGNFDFDGTGEGAQFPGQFGYNAPLYAGGNVPGGQVNNWFAKYTGYFYAATTGTYTFGLNSDDNSRLWIGSSDTAVVIDGGNGDGQGWSGAHGNIQTNAQVTLTGGQYYPITIGYSEGGGGFGLEAFYAPPGATIANGDFLPVSLLATGNPTPTYSNALKVTQNSTINLPSTYQAMYEFPSLTIGANTLNVTGGTTGAGVTIGGATTLSGTATLNLGSNAVVTLAGPVSGMGGLTQSGSGTLILGGSNTYNGATTLNGGLLIASNGTANGSATGSGVLTLNGGTLASDPVLNGAVGSVMAGAGAHYIAPGGVGAIGQLDINGNLSLNGNTTLDFDVGGGTGTLSADLLDISGSLSVSNNSAVNVVLNPASSGLTGNVYVLASFAHTGGALGVGNFNVSNVPSGYTFNVTSNALELVASNPSSGPATWNGNSASNGSGNWGNGNYWSPQGVPSGQAVQAIVGAGFTDSVGMAQVQVTLDQAVTLGQLTLANSQDVAGIGYQLVGSNALTMDNTGGSGPASILVTSASHTIAVPVNIGSGSGGTLSIQTATDPNTGNPTGLTITGSIGDQGNGTGVLELSGPGTLVLANSNTYGVNGGGTIVSGGTLIATCSDAIPAGTSLSVGSGGVFIYDPSQAPTAGSVVAAGTAAAVPEPGTLALLAAGLAAAVAFAWRRRRAAK